MGGFTCGGCEARWTGLLRAHCPACHRTFASPSLFDKHRRSYRCVDPKKVDGLEFRDGLWRGPAMTDDQKRKRFGE